MLPNAVAPMRCCCYRKGTNFQANHNRWNQVQSCTPVVVATAKVQIFKQITTLGQDFGFTHELLLLPQRYKFSSKSQQLLWHCKVYIVVVATAKVQIFKQITTNFYRGRYLNRCCCYRKGTNFQANHNDLLVIVVSFVLLLLPQRYKFSSKSQLNRVGDTGHLVVVATAKVQIFKQITTGNLDLPQVLQLLLLPQRYKFSSKSQQNNYTVAEYRCCCCYRKGTNFQANHN